MTNYLLNNYRKLKETYTHKQIRALYSIFARECIVDDYEKPSLKDFIISIDKLDIVDVAEMLERNERDAFKTIMNNY